MQSPQDQQEVIQIDDIQNTLSDLFDLTGIVIRKSIQFLLKTIFVWLPFTIIGVAVAIWITTKDEIVGLYESTMIIECYRGHPIIQAGQADKLNVLVEQEKYKRLGDCLGIDEEVAKQCKSFEVLTVDGEPMYKEMKVNYGMPFWLRITYVEPLDLDLMETKLIAYLDANPFLTRLGVKEQKTWAQKIGFLEKEQRLLDSLKIAYNKRLLSSTQHQVGDSYTKQENLDQLDLNPMHVYDKAMVYNEDLLSLKRSLVKKGNLEIIDGFLVGTPAIPKTSKVVKIIQYGAGSFIFGIFLALAILAAKQAPHNK
ncbi:MAG: hypothetical protein GY810_03290 [Aureispira sp.]|nr:hypothetical protein [Aureispira sp.]